MNSILVVFIVENPPYFERRPTEFTLMFPITPFARIDSSIIKNVVVVSKSAHTVQRTDCKQHGEGSQIRIGNNLVNNFEVYSTRTADC